LFFAAQRASRCAAERAFGARRSPQLTRPCRIVPGNGPATFVQRRGAMRILAATIVLSTAACVGGITTGAVTTTQNSTWTARALGAAPTASSSANGIEFRMFGTVPTKSAAMPNAYGMAVRQIGDEHVETSFQMGWLRALPIGKQAFVFGRAMIDMLATERRMDGDSNLSALSPTADVGIAPFGNGVCVSASATYDVHMNAPGRAIFGAFVGMCARAK
jgi:hypothetical protein